MKRIFAWMTVFIICISTAYADNSDGLIIQKGDSGELIVSIQEKLIDRGFLAGTADGKYGNQTEAAVRRFQIQEELEESGKLDICSFYLLYEDEYADPYPEQYDDLQKLYFCIRTDMSYLETLQFVERYGLPYTDKEYNGGREIKIAFSEGAARQAYADDGDYVAVHFDEIDGNSSAYEMAVVEYFNSRAFVTCFEYVGGIYWDFRNDREYAGFYVNDHFGNDGIEIVYDNGNRRQTNYLSVRSKTEQIQAIDAVLMNK